MKKKATKKVSNSETEPSVHVEPMNIDKEFVPNPTNKSIDHAENVIEKPHVKPHVDSHVELNVEVYGPIYGWSHVDPTSVPGGEPSESIDKPHDSAKPIDNHVMIDGYPVETPIFDDTINDNYVSSKDSDDDVLNDNHQNM